MPSNSNDIKVGVLITNIGSPEALNFFAVYRYLQRFLSDPRIIELSPYLWKPILHGLILPRRVPKALKNYRKVWTEQGPPLTVITRKQQLALQEQLTKIMPWPIQVAFGMHYSKPSIDQALNVLYEQGLSHLLVLPLYPQYSATTTASSFDAVYQAIKKWRRLPALRVITQYASDPNYIAALSDSIRSSWQSKGPGSMLVFSFHGLPRKYIDQGDPYLHFCQQTAQAVAHDLQLTEAQWQIAFQSRLGPLEWLKPYCDQLLVELAQQGHRKLDIICPGFAADCLETLEEMAITNQEIFQQAGGQVLNYIPALNDSPRHIDALANIIQKHCENWF